MRIQLHNFGKPITGFCGIKVWKKLNDQVKRKTMEPKGDTPINCQSLRHEGWILLIRNLDRIYKMFMIFYSVSLNPVHPVYLVEKVKLNFFKFLFRLDWRPRPVVPHLWNANLLTETQWSLLFYPHAADIGVVRCPTGAIGLNTVVISAGGYIVVVEHHIVCCCASDALILDFSSDPQTALNVKTQTVGIRIIPGQRDLCPVIDGG